MEQAYCFKCNHHIEVSNKHTVVLRSNRRAVTGNCNGCEGKVYKILPFKKEKEEIEKEKASTHPGTSQLGKKTKMFSPSEPDTGLPTSFDKDFDTQDPIITSSAEKHPSKSITNRTLSVYCFNCDDKKTGVFFSVEKAESGEFLLEGECNECHGQVYKSIKQKNRFLASTRLLNGLIIVTYSVALVLAVICAYRFF